MKESRVYSLFNVEQMLRLDHDLGYREFDIDCREIMVIGWIRRFSSDAAMVIPTEIISLIIEYIADAMKIIRQQLKECIQSQLQHASHNRLVCIIDRRTEYYDFKLLGPAHLPRYLSGSDPAHPLPNANKPQHNDVIEDSNHHDGIIILEIDQNKMNTRMKDEVYIFQPPDIYGHFHEDYAQEHLQFLSKEYMLPTAVIFAQDSERIKNRKAYIIHLIHRCLPYHFVVMIKIISGCNGM